MRLSIEELAKNIVDIEEACLVEIPGAFKTAAAEISEIFRGNDVVKTLVPLWSDTEKVWNAKIVPLFETARANAKNVSGLAQAMESYKAAEVEDIAAREEVVIPANIADI